MTNLEKYRSLLHDGVQGLLLTSRYSRMYAAEFDIAEGVAVVSAQGARYFTDSRYIESAQKNLKGFEVVEIGLNNPMMQALKATLDEFGVETLGFEDEYLTVAELNGFEAALPVKFVPLQKEINAFRASKEDWELARMRKAQEITDRAFTDVCTRIHTGMTEKELEAELIYCLYKNGAEGLSFDPIVVSGPNTSMPHGVAGSRVLQDGDFVTMDFGVLYQGYCSDMTRTVALGHATEEMRKVYDTVRRALLAGIAASHAGASCMCIDGAAIDIITESGYELHPAQREPDPCRRCVLRRAGHLHSGQIRRPHRGCRDLPRGRLRGHHAQPEGADHPLSGDNSEKFAERLEFL